MKRQVHESGLQPVVGLKVPSRDEPLEDGGAVERWAGNAVEQSEDDVGEAGNEDDLFQGGTVRAESLPH